MLVSSLNEIDKMRRQLSSVVSSYLNVYVSTPALETVEKDIEGQARLASLGAMLHIIAGHIHEDGADYDKEYIANLPKEEVEERIESLEKFIESQDAETENSDEVVRSAMNYLINDSSRKFLLEYLMREINWIIVSLLSASYISALVLMRSTFELTVGMATRETGSMTDRIYSISGLDDIEKKQIKNHWYRLCAWGHPFGKWKKEVCPIYVSHKPIYHPRLYSLCLSELIQLVDFFLVVAIAKFELNIVELTKQFMEKRVDLAGLNLFNLRIKA